MQAPLLAQAALQIVHQALDAASTASSSSSPDQALLDVLTHLQPLCEAPEPALRSQVQQTLPRVLGCMQVPFLSSACSSQRLTAGFDMQLPCSVYT